MNGVSSLCVSLVTYHFGRIVGKVVEAIFQGASTLSEMKSKAKINLITLREALVVGIQHNFIYQVEIKTLTYYRVISDNILFRLRYPQCVRHILEKFTKTGVWLLQELLQVGRCTKRQLILRVIEILKEIKGIDFDDHSEEMKIEKIISDLMQQQYLTTVIHMRQEVLNRDQVGKFTEKVESKLSSQFLVPNNPKPGEEKPGNKRVRSISSVETSAIKKRKIQIKTEPNQTLTNNEEKPAPTLQTEEVEEPLWCINPERFNYEFRKELILPFSINPESSEIVKACFNLFEQAWNYSDAMRDHPIRSKDIKNYLRDRGVDIPSDKCKKYLDLLSRDTPHILKQIQDGNKSLYYVNVPIIMKLIKETTTDSIIKDKFGPECLRIFRLVVMKKHLEEQQIADMAMVPLKDTRNCLYTLLSVDYIQLQELQKGKKHNTSIFLWSVDLPQLQERLIQDTYKTISNLLKRIEFETDSHKILLLKEQEQERRHSEGFTQQILTSEENATLKKLTELQKRLHHMILGLDRCLIILNDRSDRHIDD